eukprot:769634-Alexandrium_andersonii.AAC.1
MCIRDRLTSVVSERWRGHRSATMKEGVRDRCALFPCASAERRRQLAQAHATEWGTAISKHE